MPDEDPDINDLPTNKFYQRLDGENGIEVYYNDCSTVKSRYNDHSDHYKFCAIVVKNLKTLHNIPHDNIPDDLLCHYWNYWLYDRAINKFKITDESIYDSDIIMYIFFDLENVYERIPSLKKCMYTKHRINVEKFRKEKKKFDDNQNYENIKTIINKDNYRSYNNFFTHITNDRDLYSTIKEECHCNNENKFCVEFHKYNAANEKKQLCSLKCDSVQSSTDTKGTSKSVCPILERVSEVPAVLPPPQTENGPVVNPIPESIPQTKINPVTISSIVFTPLGSTLRQRIWKKHETFNNIPNGVAHGFLHTFPSEQINEDGKRYNLSYQSV